MKHAHKDDYWFTGTEIWEIKDKDEIKSIVELLVVKLQTHDQSNKELAKPSSSWLLDFSLSLKVRQILWELLVNTLIWASTVLFLLGNIESLMDFLDSLHFNLIIYN